MQKRKDQPLRTELPHSDQAIVETYLAAMDDPQPVDPDTGERVATAEEIANLYQ